MSQAEIQRQLKRYRDDIKSQVLTDNAIVNGLRDDDKFRKVVGVAIDSALSGIANREADKEAQARTAYTCLVIILEELSERAEAERSK